MSASNGSARPSKRFRADPSDDDDALRTSSSGALGGQPWLADGNIILQAKNKYGVDVQFRVFKSLLISSSTVFADMFTVAQPGEINSEDGCAIVVFPDDASQIEDLLKVIFDFK